MNYISGYPELSGLYHVISQLLSVITMAPFCRETEGPSVQHLLWGQAGPKTRDQRAELLISTWVKCINKFMADDGIQPSTSGKLG